MLQIKLDAVHHDILRELKETKIRLIDAQLQVNESRLDEIESSIVEEKRSLRLFYYGIFLGVLTGILGNYFVSYVFTLLKPSNEMALAGLIASGSLIVIICTIIWVKHIRR